jgi:protease IV
MNRKIALILVVFILVVLIGVVAISGLFIYLVSRPPQVAADSVLELSLGGSVREVPPQDPLTMLFEGDNPSLWDLHRTLHRASDDRRIKSISLEIYPLMADWGKVEELRLLLQEFQKSGKEIHVFLAGDLTTEKEMYLATVADHISMNPNASVLFDGLMAEVVFMKRTLEKLGVKPQFIQFKEYKSAETYTRQELTPEIREMLRGVISDIQDRFIREIAEDRGIPEDAVRELVNVGLLSGPQAVTAGLVDEVEYRSAIRERLQGNDDEYRSISWPRYRNIVDRTGAGRGDARVAVVGTVGTIISGGSEGAAGLMGGRTVADQLRRLREDDSIDGVILRVDSPGGSAVGSDMIWAEVHRLEEDGKPVVVSMSGVAGSGGYYISMPARHIVSQPSTITGSIGVIFGKFDISGFYNWIGMDIERVMVAPNSDFFSFTSSLSEEQLKRVTEWTEQTYQTFVQKAAEGRGMEFDELEQKAHGRIYTGSQALEIGLVDSLGGFAEATSQMRAALGLEADASLQLELYPKPKTLLESLTSGDFFQIESGQVKALIRSLATVLEELERPSMWMLAPTITIN